MQGHSAPILAALTTIALLGGCVAETGGTAGDHATCRPERTGQLVGLTDPTDRQVMEITGASRVRRAVEGAPMTMELLPFRATVILDARTKKVVDANCS